MQQGLKYVLSTKEYLFYNRNKAKATKPEYPCSIKLRSVGFHVNATLLNFKLSGIKTRMRQRLTLITSLFVTAIISSCKKDNNTKSDCFPNTPTVRQITNAQARVKAAGGKFYILEQGTIDTKLNPCTLAQEFQVDNLQVTISGDVKLTQHGGVGPCCIDNFVITTILR
jgi:hypothetical protein